MSTERIERWLSIAVGIAAVAAVAVALYQASLARQQLRASAWPYVTQGNGFTPAHDYQYQVANEGIGPARVRTFQVYADGKAMLTWNAAVRALTGEGEPRLIYSSFHRGSVLPAGSNKVLVTLPGGPRAQAYWLAAQTRLRTVVCYCSVYDECWRADSDVDEPAPVAACTGDRTLEFQQ